MIFPTQYAKHYKSYCCQLLSPNSNKPMKIAVYNFSNLSKIPLAIEAQYDKIYCSVQTNLF
jgi:hypothetical protein